MTADPEFTLLDWTGYGVPADVMVRAWPMGMITFHRGDASATIDTTDMTREEVVRSIAVALWQLDEQKDERGLNRKKRRQAQAWRGTRH